MQEIYDRRWRTRVYPAGIAGNRKASQCNKKGMLWHSFPLSSISISVPKMSFHPAISLRFYYFKQPTLCKTLSLKVEGVSPPLAPRSGHDGSSERQVWTAVRNLNVDKVQPCPAKIVKRGCCSTEA